MNYQGNYHYQAAIQGGLGSAEEKIPEAAIIEAAAYLDLACGTVTTPLDYRESVKVLLKALRQCGWKISPP